MTTLPHIISLSNLQRQTGMTTLGVSMVNGATVADNTEHPDNYSSPLFIARTQTDACYLVKLRGLKEDRAFWFARVLRDNGMTPSLVVIDDCDQYTLHDLRHLIGAIVNRMQAITTPCQIVLLRNPFNVKDLF